MKLSAFQLKQQTQQSSNMDASFGNGSHSNQNVSAFSSNYFGSLKPGASIQSKVGSHAQSTILNDNKENSSLGNESQKQIKGILKNSTKQGGSQYNSIIGSQIVSQNSNGIQSSAFYRGQALSEQNDNILAGQDDAKNILMRVDNLLSQSSLAINNPQKFFTSQNLLQQSQLTTYSQFSSNQYASLPSSSSGILKTTSNNQDLRSYINNLESKVLKKREKDLFEIKKSAKLAQKKKRQLRRRKDSDSSISSIVEEKESDLDSSSSSSDSSSDEYENKYLSKRSRARKQYQYKNEVGNGKDFKEPSQRSKSQNILHSKKYDQNNKNTEKADKSKRNQSQNERKQEKKSKQEKQYNQKNKKEEEDYLSVSSYQSNVTHNGLNFNRNANFATDLVFCIVCEDYIHVEKVDEHSKYCEENQQILSQSRRIVEQLSQKNEINPTSKAAESLYQVEKLNQKLMKIKIYLEEMKINPNIVNSSKIKQYANFLTQCCMNVISNNSYSNEMAQSLNDLHILNKKVSDLENLSNKAVILSILVLGDKLKDFTKKKLEILDNQPQQNIQFQKNNQYDTKSQADAFSDLSSVKNLTQNNLPSTPSTQNQEKKIKNNNIFQKQHLNPHKTNSASDNLSSYQQLNSQSDLDSYSVSSQSIRDQKNNLVQRLNSNPNYNQNNNLTQQQLQQKYNQQGRRPLSKIFLEEKPRESQFKVQQVTHINYDQQQRQQPQQYNQQQQYQSVQQNQQQVQLQQHQTQAPNKQNALQLSPEVEKKNFFELAVNMKKQYPSNRAIQQLLVVDLYNQFMQTRKPYAQAEAFIQNAFNNVQ